MVLFVLKMFKTRILYINKYDYAQPICMMCPIHIAHEDASRHGRDSNTNVCSFKILP